MELRHLRAFVAVGEELHFGRAAQRLHVAQPPLSQLIKGLERELGVELFTRTTRQVKLTPTGKVFLEYVRSALDAVDRARESVRRAGRGEIGQIRVGFTGLTTCRVLPVVARAYRERFPQVRLDLHTAMFSGEQVQGLLDGVIDVGFIRIGVSTPKLESRVLEDDPIVLVLSESHPLTSHESIRLADLAAERFVSYPSRRGSSLRDAVVIACTAAGFTPQVVQEAPDTHTIMSLVGADVGVALLPGSVADLHMEGVVYRPVSDPTPQVPLAMAWRRGDDSPVLAGFLRVATDVLQIRPRQPLAS
jgi:DNA-binding transcriptional LysR family regulator